MKPARKAETSRIVFDVSIDERNGFDMAAICCGQFLNEWIIAALRLQAINDLRAAGKTAPFLHHTDHQC